jgi:hypothetical protein
MGRETDGETPDTLRQIRADGFPTHYGTTKGTLGTLRASDCSDSYPSGVRSAMAVFGLQDGV